MPRPHGPSRARARHRLAVATLALAGLTALAASPAGAAPTGHRGSHRAAHAVVAAEGAWCAEHGATVGAWTGGHVDLPVCGPGPAYGGTLATVDLPGPGGSMARYYNATPGFQCVELAERYLAVVDGLAPVEANGSTLAAAYHAADPRSRLTVDGTPGAVGHPPLAGDAISFSLVPSFLDPTDGHVAVVVASAVDRATGDGTVVVAQENVAPSDYRMVLDVHDWRLYDPAEPADAALQYPYAEWFHPLPPAGTTS